MADKLADTLKTTALNYLKNNKEEQKTAVRALLGALKTRAEAIAAKGGLLLQLSDEGTAPERAAFAAVNTPGGKDILEEQGFTVARPSPTIVHIIWGTQAEREAVVNPKPIEPEVTPVTPAL